MSKLRNTALMILAGATLVVAAPAGAEAYDTTDDGLTVSTAEGGSTVAPGGSVTVVSSGWKTNDPVNVALHSDPVQLGTVTSSSVGTVAASFVIPATTPAGDHHIVLTGTDASGNPRTVEEPITVAGVNAAATPDQLSFTGSSAIPLAVAGAVLAGGGASLLRFRRRRLGVA